MRVWAFMCVLAILGITYNNCSKLEVTGEEENSGLGTGDEEVFMAGAKRVPGSNIYSLQAFGQIARDLPVSFAIDPAGFLQGTAFIWDHKLTLEDGSVAFCEQEADLQSWIVHLNCSDPGQLDLDVMAILPDDSDQRYAGNVEVYGEPRTDLPEDEDGGNGGNPGEPVSGAQLYSFNCQGCHGTLANSTKRGRSAQAIQSAINNEQRMRFLSFLTAADVAAIAQALQ